MRKETGGTTKRKGVPILALVSATVAAGLLLRHYRRCAAGRTPGGQMHLKSAECGDRESVSDSPIVEGGFESSNIHKVERQSRDRFTVRLISEEPSDHTYPGHRFYWFYLKVTGAGGRTVTIDVVNCEWMPRHWKTYRPVYTYSRNPNEPGDHDWRRVDKAKLRGKVFSITHRFTEDTAFVALRYPYTCTYLRSYLKALGGNPHVRVDTAGKSDEDRDIWLVTVTDTAYPVDEKKGIWLIAKEHGCEQDCSWVIEGVIEYLLSDDPVAASLRKKAVFAMVPIAAPDAAFHGRAVNPTTGFDVSHRYSEDPVFAGRPARMSTEGKAIWKCVEAFVGTGGSVDLAAVLHNPHGAEPNVWSWYSKQYKAREHRAFNRSFFSHLPGYTTGFKEGSYGLYRFAFNARCALEYGSLGYLYEVNQHAKRRFLTISDLRKMGKAFARGVSDYYGLGPDG